jgi:hypothetical protein
LETVIVVTAARLSGSLILQSEVEIKACDAAATAATLNYEAGAELFEEVPGTGPTGRS